jgi:hypothetical protein
MAAYPAASEPLPSKQYDAVKGEEGRRVERLGKNGAKRVFEAKSKDASWDRGDNDQPGQSLVRRRDAAMSDRTDEPANDPYPVAPKDRQQRKRSCYVQADDERQVWRLRLRLSRR